MSNPLDDLIRSKIKVDPNAALSETLVQQRDPLDYDKGLHRNLDINSLRASNQSTGQALIAGTLNAITETGLGVLEGAGYLLDLPQWKNIIFNQEKEYSNWFSDSVKELKKDTNQPVFGGDGFQPGNAKWWAKHLPSIASSVSLLIPAKAASTALTKGVGLLSKSKNLSKVDDISAAIFSRYMENTMEASGKAEEIYTKQIESGKSEEEAREEAGKVASNVWYANLVNLATDVPQFMMIGSFANKSIRDILKDSANQSGKLRQVAGAMASEGLEEGVQFGIGKEAEKSNGSMETLGKVMENFGSYFSDDEFKSSLLLGAIGGGFFQAIGKSVDKKVVKKSIDRLGRMKTAISNDDVVTQKEIENEVIAENTVEELKSKGANEEIIKKRKEFEKTKNKHSEAGKPEPVANKEAELDTKIKTAYEQKKEIKTEKEAAKAALVNPASENLAEENSALDHAVLTNVIKKKLKNEKKKTKKNDKLIAKLEAKLAKLEPKKKAKIDKQNPDVQKLEKVVEQEVQNELNLEQAKEEKREINTVAKQEEIVETKAKEEFREVVEKTDTEQLMKGYDNFEGEEKKIVREELEKKRTSTKDAAPAVENKEDYLEHYEQNPIDRLLDTGAKSNEELEENLPTPESRSDSTIYAYSPDTLKIKKDVDKNTGNDILRIIDGKIDRSEYFGYDVTFYDKNNTKGEIIIGDRKFKYNPLLEKGLAVPLVEITDNSRTVLLSDRAGVDRDALERLSDGDEITLVAETNPKFDEDPMKFKIRLLDSEGNQVGVLHGGKEYRKRIIKLREKLFEEWDKTNGYVFKDKLQVTNKNSGTLNYRDEYTNLGNVISDNQPLIFIIQGSEGTPLVGNISVKSDTELVVGTETYNIDNARQWYNKLSSNLGDTEHSKGKVFYLYKDTEGKAKIVRAFTEQVGKNRDRKLEVLRAIKNNDTTAFEKIVALSKSKDKNTSLGKQNRKMARRTNVGLSGRYSKGKKAGDVFLHKGSILNVNGIPHELIEGSRKTGYKLEELNEDFTPTGNISKTRTVEDLIADKTITLNEEYTFYEYHKLGGKPVHIDKLKINISRKGNEKISELLDTNLDVQKPFINPSFELTEIVGETKPVKEVTEESPTTNPVEKPEKESLFTEMKDSFEDPVSDMDYREFKKGKVNKLVLASIAAKLDGTEELSNREKEIANEKLAEIDTMLQGIKATRSAQESFNKSTDEHINNLKKGRKKRKSKFKTASVTKAELKAKEWFQERFPNTPIHLFNLPSKIAGEFTGVAINLWEKNALFHESFHFLFNNILTEKQRNTMLGQAEGKYKDDYKSKFDSIFDKNFVRKSDGEQFTAETAKIETLEELLADDFELYVIAKQTEYLKGGFLQRLGSRITRFFERMYNLIEYSYDNQPTIEKIFRYADSGVFKDKKVITRKAITSKYSLKTKLAQSGAFNSPSEMQEAIDIGAKLLVDSIQELQSKKVSWKEIRRLILSKDLDENLITSNEYDQAVFAKIEDEYYKTKEENGENEEYTRQMGAFLSTLREGDQFGLLTKIIERRIADYGYIVLREDDIVADDESVTRDDHSDNVMKVDRVDRLSKELRSYFSKLPVVKKVNGELVAQKGFLGFDKTYGLDYVYKKLQRVLGDSNSSIIMMDKLNAVALEDPLFERIKLDLDNDSQLKTKVFVGIGSKYKPRFITILSNFLKNGLVNSNHNTHVTSIVKDLQLSLDLNSRKAIPLKNASFRQIIDSLGLTLPKSVYRAVGNKNPLSKVINSRNKKKYESFINDSDPIGNDNKLLQAIAKALKAHYPVNFQATHSHPDGGQVYEWLDGNYIAKFVNKIKDNGSFKNYFDSLHAHPVYSKLPIVQRFAANLGLNGDYTPIDTNQFDWVVVSGIDDGRGTKPYAKMGRKHFYQTIWNMFASESSRTIIPMPVHSDSGNMTGIQLNVEQDVYGKTVDYLLPQLVQLVKAVNSKEEQEIKNYKGKTKDTLFGIKKGASDLEIEKQVRKLIENETANLTKTFKELEIKGITQGAAGQLQINQFVATYMLYHTQFSMLLNGDFAYYKSTEDFYKRAKQIWSPGLYLDPTAKWGDEQIPSTYKVKIEKDEESTFQYEDFKKHRPDVAEQYKDSVAEKDAQSYTDPMMYRNQEIGLGRWSDYKEAEYNKVIWRKDSDMTFSVRKPFFFSMLGGTLPFQNKDSEFVVTPKMAKGNPKFKKILEGFGYTFDAVGNVLSTPIAGHSSRKYDKLTFDSAIKVGMPLDSDTVSLPFADWRLQMETPEHHMDTVVTFGTQVRKHMMTGRDFDPEYNQLIIEQLQEDYQDVIGKFTNFKDLIALIKEELAKKGQAEEYFEGLELVNISETSLPIWHPLHLGEITAILHSLFKSRVSRQKLTNGATYVNLSSNAFERKPKIVFKEDGSVDYVEAYVGRYSKQFKGLEDVEAENLEGIFWRIPTEGKHFITKIKVIGFLPDESGGAIVLPPDLMIPMGFDFDIDKMFGFFKIKNPKTSKEIRQNKLFDIYAKWLGTKSELDFLATNTDILKKNNKALGLDKLPNLNPMFVDSWVEMADRMLTGKSIIGIAANGSAAFPILQHEDLKLKTPFKFNGQEYTEIAPKDKVVQIVKNLGQLLAGAVDNGKDPVLPLTNINNHTMDIASSMVLLGIDLVEIQTFLGHPDIAQFTQDILSVGEQKAKELAKIRTGIEVRRTQKLELPSFTSRAKVGGLLYAKDNLAELGELTRIIKASENGLQNTDEKNLLILDSLSFDRSDEANPEEVDGDYVAGLLSKKFPGIDGINNLLEIHSQTTEDVARDLNGNVTNNTEIESHFKHFSNAFNSVMRKGRQTIIGATGLPDKNKGIFKSNIDKLGEYTQYVTAKDLEFVNANAIDYAASDVYKFDKELIATLPQRVKDFRESNPNNLFLSNLETFATDKIGVKGRFRYLAYKKVAGQSPRVQANITEVWDAMLKSANPDEVKLAEDLITYAIMMSGFRFAKFSFSPLIPQSYFVGNRDKINDLHKNIKALESVHKEDLEGKHEQFFNQFIRNHYRTLTYVPLLVNSKGRKDFTYETKEVESSVKITKDGDKAKVGVVKSSKKTLDNKQIFTTSKAKKHSGVGFVDFVKIRDGGDYRLYQKIKENNYGKGEATYKRIQPLGVYSVGSSTAIGMARKGKIFTEWSYGNSMAQSEVTYNNKQTTFAGRDGDIFKTSNC